MYECYVELGADKPTFYHNELFKKKTIANLKELKQRDDVVNVTAKYSHLMNKNLMVFMVFNLYLAMIYLAYLKGHSIVTDANVLTAQYMIPKITLTIFIVFGAISSYQAWMLMNDKAGLVC